MPESIVTPAAPVAPSQATQAVTTPAVAPASVVETPAAVSSPAEQQVSTTEAAPSPPSAPESPATTAIGAELAKLANEPNIQEVVKVAESAEPKKEEGKQSAEPAPLPTYEAFKLPEGVTFDDSKISEFYKELGEFQNLTKADQAEMQKFGQKLIDRHVADIKDIVQKLGERNAETWKSTRDGWKAAFEKDPEIGGNRKETTLNAVNAVLAMASTLDPATGAPYTDAKVKASRVSELSQLMETGFGDHPALIRTFSNINKIISDKNKIIADLRTKYESEAGVALLPGTKPEPQYASKVAKRYGGSK